MKRMIIASALIGLGTAAMAAEEGFMIKGVEVSGYLDMSISSTKSDAGTDTSYGLDTAEIRFKSELADDVYIEAHIAGSGGTNSLMNSVELEQAFMTYTGVSNLTIIGGKFLSSLGWEAYHAPDLFQYSTSATLVYPGMQNGAAAKYTFDSFSVYAAALAGVWDNYDKDGRRGGVEGHIRFTGVEDLTIFVGGARESYGAYQQSLINVWGSYSIDNLLLAAEFNSVLDWGADGTDGFGWLFMANYTFTDQLGLTLRTSGLMVEDDAGADVNDDIKFTIAPSYALTDNMSFVLEYNILEDGVADDTIQTAAFETIVTF
ncbi:outer membrane beta-barrel protein [Pontiella sp.]|uniref:outer membrane beta-barrel protein n=1 Tax=Pontiella sp. TaxID=2837462 RepID=UPI0035667A28